MQEAISLGNELYQKLQQGASKGEIIDLIKTKNPSLNVYSTENLRQQMFDGGDYDAFYQYHMRPDFEIIDKNLYLNFNNANKDVLKRLTFAMDTAHEYTHVKQTETKDIEFLKKISGNDGEYACFLPAMGDFIFKIFDTQVKNDMVTNTFDFQDQLNTLRTGVIVPREKKISEDILLKNNKIKNEKEFNDIINSTYNAAFIQIMQHILKHPEMGDEKFMNTLYRIASQEGGLEKLRDDLKQFCANSAKKEKEAYTTESAVAKKCNADK